jgi:hypothetical protein
MRYSPLKVAADLDAAEIAAWLNGNAGATQLAAAEHFGAHEKTISRVLIGAGYWKQRLSEGGRWVQGPEPAREPEAPRNGRRGWSTKRVTVTGAELADFINPNVRQSAALATKSPSPAVQVQRAADHFGISGNSVRRQLERAGYKRDGAGEWTLGTEEESGEMTDSLKKERDALVRLANDRGWTITRITGGNMEWRPPKGRPVYENPNESLSGLRKRLFAGGLMGPVVDVRQAAQEPEPELEPELRVEASDLDHALRAASSELMADIDGQLQAVTTEGLGSAVLALEEMVMEVAENFGQHRAHVDDVLPAVRRDIQVLKDAPKPPSIGELRAMWNELIGAELLKVRVDFDRQLAKMREEMETQVLELISATEAKMAVRDPLAGVRAAMNGGRRA